MLWFHFRPVFPAQSLPVHDINPHSIVCSSSTQLEQLQVLHISSQELLLQYRAHTTPSEYQTIQIRNFPSQPARPSFQPRIMCTSTIFLNACGHPQVNQINTTVCDRVRSLGETCLGLGLKVVVVKDWESLCFPCFNRNEAHRLAWRQAVDNGAVLPDFEEVSEWPGIRRTA